MDMNLNEDEIDLMLVRISLYLLSSIFPLIVWAVGGLNDGPALATVRSIFTKLGSYVMLNGNLFVKIQSATASLAFTGKDDKEE